MQVAIAPVPLKFIGSYRYAQANGFTGTHGEYVDLQYKAYADTCKRVDVRPQSFAVWYSVQTH